MKAKKIIYSKTYTRDDCIILQEFWSDLFNKNIPDIKWAKPKSPVVINYMNNGAIELWENKKGINLYIQKVFEKNKKNPKFFLGAMEKYSMLLGSLEKCWNKKILTDVNELKDFISLFSEAIYLFSLMYYTVMNKKTPKKLMNAAIKLRRKDVFFDKSDKLIRKSLTSIYPELKGEEIAILFNEITKPPKKNLLMKRHESFIIIGLKYHKLISLSDFLRNNVNYYFKQDNVGKKAIKNIKGATAYRGYVIGKAIIIKQKEKINKIRRGQIIIATMTTPEFIPAMKKAGAIITDEGGITCHAAIISRELGIPCVIGTKIATKVLKDGDLVEVDANKGVVKIIKSNK